MTALAAVSATSSWATNPEGGANVRIAHAAAQEMQAPSDGLRIAVCRLQFADLKACIMEHQVGSTGYLVLKYKVLDATLRCPGMTRHWNPGPPKRFALTLLGPPAPRLAGSRNSEMCSKT